MYKVVVQEHDCDTDVETGLTLGQAEDLLCRCCNEDVDAYIVEEYHG